MGDDGINETTENETAQGALDAPSPFQAEYWRGIALHSAINSFNGRDTNTETFVERARKFYAFLTSATE